MATPKVFVSSTCFDLSEIREQLKKFIESFGFDAILSDHGDVFYNPELHTHEACLHEVSNCQMFILIIGGRYGGRTIADKEKSITNAEFDAAIESNIPTFTYIKKDVLSDHHLYGVNKNSDFATKIKYPSITKKDDAICIFNFIDSVRRREINNGFEGFDKFSDIETHLRKQWAGMFFDFLKTKEIKNQIDATNHLLEGLKNSHEKLEEITEKIFINSSENDQEAKKELENINKLFKMKNFLEEAITYSGLNNLTSRRGLRLSYQINNRTINQRIGLEAISKKTPKELSIIDPTKYSWDEYLVEIGILENDNFLFSHLTRNTDRNSSLILEKMYEDSFLISTPNERELIFKENFKTVF